MPRFRYEATDRMGIPVHGTADADNDAALSETLAARGLRLVSCSELSLDALIASHHETLPRLYQLRVGEQLREAVLSGLPAHEAVRSVAAEPLSHPMLGIAPWLQCIATVVFAATMTIWSLTGELAEVTIGTGVLAVVVVPLVWVLLHQNYLVRPKQLLRLLADRLETGEQLPTGLDMATSSELQCVMNSDVSDDVKAGVAADLVPCLLGSNLKTQQFVMVTIAPLVMLGVTLAVIYTGLLFVIPQFKSIFDGFGVELPTVTTIVIQLSDLIAALGIVGWILMIALGCALLILAAIGMTTGWVAEVLSRIPVFGMAFRWNMQAKVARILAAMLRNNCDYAEALRTATAGSGFASVQSIGRIMATEIESGSGHVLQSSELSAIPISMMFVTDSGGSNDERRFGMAKTFQGLAEMLESATLSQGRLFSFVVQSFTLMIGSFAIAGAVLAMFLPLIQLLNDLS